jgi:hypothetical protein
MTDQQVTLPPGVRVIDPNREADAMAALREHVRAAMFSGTRNEETVT